MVVSPDRIRSEDLCLHYRFMRELLCPPVLVTKDNYWSRVGKKGALVTQSLHVCFRPIIWIRLCAHPWRSAMHLGWPEPWRCPSPPPPCSPDSPLTALSCCRWAEPYGSTWSCLTRSWSALGSGNHTTHCREGRDCQWWKHLWSICSIRRAKHESSECHQATAGREHVLRDPFYPDGTCNECCLDDAQTWIFLLP